MNKFINSHKVYLTPISPIHIGCGEDFEPTNYVIEGDILYYFDPSQLQLSEAQKRELISYSEANELHKIYRFFANDPDLISQIKEKSKYTIDIVKSLGVEWKNKLGTVVQREPQSNVFNKLFIERCAFNPFLKQSYIPASGVKGAIFTVILNEFNQKDNLSDFEKSKDKLDIFLKDKYLGDAHFLHKNGQRQLSQDIKITDFMPEKTVFTKIFYVNNYLKSGKSDRGKIKYAQGIYSRRECILYGQYRAYSSNISLTGSKITISSLFKSLRDFYLPIFYKESEHQVKIGLLDEKYFREIKSILANENIALIRLGKSGSEDKVYQDNTIRKIEIKLNKEERLKSGKATDIRSSSKTYWLAGDELAKSANDRPLGWAIIEYQNLDDQNSELKQWCDSRIKTPLQKKVTMQELEQIAAKQAELEAKNLAALSEHQQLIILKLKEWENVAKYQLSSSPVFSEAKKLLEQAISDNWSIEDKKALYTALDPTDSTGILNQKILDIDKLNSKPKDKKSAVAVFKKLRDSLVVE
ncbi:hypothetical protein A1D22_03420 [Pasteurellaceae bacterium LFhippo2]|nr:hypothetical protein [Pasteurellaceae bacterium LFhippo2]